MSILLQLERSPSGMIAPNANVIFDSTIISNGTISYDSATGIITLQAAGRYEITWWVATQSTFSVIGTGFALISSQGDSIIANSPINIGEMVGIGIIEVTAAPVTVELRNNSGAEIYHSTIVPVKASLTLIGEDDMDIAGPTGPTGAQGDTGPTGPQGDAGPTGASGLAPIAVYNTNLSASGSAYDVPVGNVIYRLQYSTSSSLSLSVSALVSSITVDIKRSSQYDSAVEGSTLNGVTLTPTSVQIDSLIYSNSNEMHRTWIRQQDPDTSLWSLYEIDLFTSVAGARTSIWVYLIYENADFIVPVT